jgi:hypothetical protein
MTVVDLAAHLTPEQQGVLRALTSPFQIQAFLDELPYSADHFNRCPRRVLEDRLANCFDGALFAAAALRRLGHPPLLVNLFPAEGTDDDHVIAIYKRAGCWGTVAKSNCVGIRFRDPIYRSLRELVMSYFEFYFNVYGGKTLRSFTRPLHLEPFDRAGWMWNDAGLEPIIARLDGMRRIPVLSPQQVAKLSPVDKRTLEAGFLGANEAGLYRPHSSPESGDPP